MRISNSSRFATVVAAAALAISACGGTSAESHTDYGVFENLADRHHGTARTGAVYDSPKTAMPQIRYSICLLYTSPSPRDKRQSRMPSSA